MRRRRSGPSTDLGLWGCGRGEREKLRAGWREVTPLFLHNRPDLCGPPLSTSEASGEDGWGPQGAEGEGIPAGSGWVSLGT